MISMKTLFALQNIVTHGLKSVSRLKIGCLRIIKIRVDLYLMRSRMSENFNYQNIDQECPTYSLVDLMNQIARNVFTIHPSETNNVFLSKLFKNMTSAFFECN